GGLFLDERRQDDELLRRLERKIGRVPVPDFLDQTLLRRLHALNDQLAADAAREIVGVGQQTALARDFLDVAGEDIVRQQTRHDLLGGQTLGKADLMRNDFAVDDGGDHVAQAGMGAELVFTRFEILARLERQHAADEDPGLVDDAFALQDVGNVADAGAVRNIDDLVRRQRAGRLEPLLAEDQRGEANNRQQHEEAENGVADDDERVASAA